LWQQATDAASSKALALQVPLERPAGVAAVYSDIGFLLLGCALEAANQQPLDRQWAQLRPADWPFLDYCPPASMRPTIAPTEDDSWRGRRLQGEVHDENAAVLGGVAAHAGLFGSAAAVGRFGADVLRSFSESTWLATPGLIRTFAARQLVPGSSRALGWDTMLPTSSCGTRLSPTSIGHTGFTGTSLWIDWERDLYVVLLTNRVHPTRSNARFPPMRARIHDAIAEDLADLKR
jgi:CubicO group peptidase (beta-lactamase class C family)